MRATLAAFDMPAGLTRTRVDLPRDYTLRTEAFFGVNDIELWRGREIIGINTANKTLSFLDGAEVQQSHRGCVFLWICVCLTLYSLAMIRSSSPRAASHACGPSPAPVASCRMCSVCARWMTRERSKVRQPVVSRFVLSSADHTYLPITDAIGPQVRALLA